MLVTCLAFLDEWLGVLCRFCGHGAGEAYFNREAVASELPRCSVALLMGCSSGKLRRVGDYEPAGTALCYLMANAPAVVANLWDVTDKDIDRFCISLLDHLVGTAPATDGAATFDSLGEAGTEIQADGTTRQLLAAVRSARRSCRQPFLVGAAPVCYGVPVCVRRDPPPGRVRFHGAPPKTPSKASHAPPKTPRSSRGTVRRSSSTLATPRKTLSILQQPALGRSSTVGVLEPCTPRTGTRSKAALSARKSSARKARGSVSFADLIDVGDVKVAIDLAGDENAGAASHKAKSASRRRASSASRLKTATEEAPRSSRSSRTRRSTRSKAV